MMTITASDPGQLSDPDLLRHLQLAAQAERHATAQLIALLMELDSRRLYLGELVPERAGRSLIERVRGHTSKWRTDINRPVSIRSTTG